MNTFSQNACKQCAPLGASLVFKGLANTISLLHGSQGCSTYIRRYLISHFREPVDIASSNFTEETAIFGGGKNLKKSITNVMIQYKPECIGIASTCLSETIGEDIEAITTEYCKEHNTVELPEIVCASTPSYKGTHSEGFYKTVLACVKRFAAKNMLPSEVAVFPGMLSPADIRYIKQILACFSKDAIVFPDYSDTLDGGLWNIYHPIPPGGTSIEALRRTGNSSAVIEFSSTVDDTQSAGAYLCNNMNIPLHRIHIPIGVRLTDIFFNVLTKITGKDIPEWIETERERVLDMYTDGHKYLFGKRVLLYGDEDLVIGLFSFCQEIGLFPVLCCSGNASGKLSKVIQSLKDHSIDYETVVHDGFDFEEIEEAALTMNIDLMIGNSKGYKLSRKLNVPLVRTGFPVHDRIGAGHIMHIGYYGAFILFERIVNMLIEIRQQADGIQYGYI